MKSTSTKNTMMKKAGLVIALSAMSIASVSYAAKAESKAVPAASATASKIDENSPEPQKLAYSFGYLFGKSYTESVKDLDINSFIQGFREGYAGQSVSLTEAQMKAAIIQFKQSQDAQEMKAFKAEADKNAKAGQDFLAENAKKPGVVTTKSGLEYLVIQQGKGKQPSSTSQVKVHYEGRLIDGTVFDSSIDRGEPLTFPLDQVITGWTEGLQLMKEGSKYRFFIPAKLAYGETGANTIPPNSTLVFDVELLEVIKADAIKAEAPKK